MGNKNSSGTTAVGKDVIQQTENTSTKFYELLDIKNGGTLITAFRRAQAIKDYTEVDGIIAGLKDYLYNNGEGKNVNIAYLVNKRGSSRETNTVQRSTRRPTLCCPTGVNNRRIHSTVSLQGSRLALINAAYGTDISEDEKPQYRHLCWRVDELGAVGESLLHLCLLNATRTHFELARHLIKAYPKLVNDIYISDEYYGENCLHMAIVNEDLAMVHFLCKYGIDIHQRACGAFFCPEDQKSSREDDESQEPVALCTETNYQSQSNTYWGEYPLSFAVSLGQADTIRYLLRRKACPNKQDTNGNTVMHMAVIHDRQDMYDLLLEYGNYCPCDECAQGVNVKIRNNQGFIPLTLAAKLARKEMFHHIMNKSREVFWEYGGVTCAAFPLYELDTVGNEGQVIERSAINIIIHEDSREHLELLDGIVHNVLNEKWRNGCRARFFQLFAVYILYLIIFSIALSLRPVKDPNCNGTSKNVTSNYTMSNSTGNWTLSNITLEPVKCDPCFLRNIIYVSTSQQVRGVFEILSNIWALAYLLLVVLEMYLQGPRTVFWGLVYNPIRGFFVLSCAMVPCCLAARLTCHVAFEDHMTIIALILAWPYSLNFCKGFQLTGPYVVMIWQMLKRDFIIFFIIYAIFVIGFSQAMFLVMNGHADDSVDELLFSRWFASGLALIIMSLGEFGDLHYQLMESGSPYKIIGIIIFFTFMVIGALLTFNMLIAMMGNTYLTVSETEKEWTRQWAQIVLDIERMLTPKQKLKLQLKYSEQLGQTKQRALIMRIRQNKDRQQSKVSHDPKQQSTPKGPTAKIPASLHNSGWLNK